MQARRTLMAFAFTMLTILLLLIVTSRTSEAVNSPENNPLDADIGQAMPQATEPAKLPGSKEEDNSTEAEKPDIDITSWEYILAGPGHNIERYAPPETVSIEGTASYFDSRAVTALVDFLNAARSAGFSPYIMVAYRSYSTQEYILNGKASQIAWPEYPTEEDYELARESVANPGESDHQTGLGVDITDKYYGVMDADLMDQSFLAWMQQNCADYGFILRYPVGKESITGRSEAWHFRYVGKEAAAFIMDHNLCLEQFVALYE